MNLRKARVILLSGYFFFSFVYQPYWVSDNFWYKADFWDTLPFNFPYLGFILIYASLTTALFELFIRFIKKFA